MSIQSLIRCGVALCLVTLVSGCSMLNFWDSDAESESVDRNNACSWNRSSCMYEGQYEPGEREYAEEQAKRLNRSAAASVRIRTVK